MATKVIPLFLTLTIMLMTGSALPVKEHAAVNTRCCNSGARWVKLNRYPACFSAKGKSPGVFHSTIGGAIHKIKLVYRSGGVSCNGKTTTAFSCNPTTQGLMVLVTDVKNQLIAPPPVPNVKYFLYNAPGYPNGSANVVVLPTGINSYTVAKGDALKIWYSEDYYSHTISDNQGTTCTDIYGLM